LNIIHIDVFFVYCQQNYDAVVGDITIVYNRSLYIDYTLPFTESGVSMIACSDCRQQQQKRMGLHETFDMGPLGDQFFVLCFHWICGLGS
jgi:hypothetical protein